MSEADFEPTTPLEVLGLTDLPPATEEAPKAPTKKRARKPAKKLGNGVVIIGKNFSDSYMGRLVPKAIFIEGVDAAFASIPTAVSWLEDNVKNEEERAKYINVLADDYEQQAGNLVRSRKREFLKEFGGELYFPEWYADFELWDQLTETKGTTVTEYNDAKKGNATKKGKGKDQRVHFEAASYVIAYGKGAAGCKKVNAVDGDTEKTVKKPLTPVTAYRKVVTFANTHRVDPANKESEALFVKTALHLDSCVAHVNLVRALAALTPEQSVNLRNHIASTLCGVDVYGPAFVIFTRKLNVKI